MAWEPEAEVVRHFDDLDLNEERVLRITDEYVEPEEF